MIETYGFGRRRARDFELASSLEFVRKANTNVSARSSRAVRVLDWYEFSYTKLGGVTFSLELKDNIIGHTDRLIGLREGRRQKTQNNAGQKEELVHSFDPMASAPIQSFHWTRAKRILFPLLSNTLKIPIISAALVFVENVGLSPSIHDHVVNEYV